MRYTTPTGFKMALETRLQAEALATGRPLQRLRQLVVFERFLARLFQGFGPSAVLKGGMVLELRLSRARTTRDLDLRLTGHPERLLQRLQEVGRVDLEDFFSFEVVPDAHHPAMAIQGQPYEAQRYRVEGHLAGKLYGARFQMDAAVAEPLVMAPEKLIAPGFLEFAGVVPAELWVYPIEVHIAEELHAFTLPRVRENSRVKDLPDLALLATSRQLEAETVRAAIEQTFLGRGTHALPHRVPAPPISWATPYAVMAEEDQLPWRSLAEVTQAIRSFLDPLLEGHSGRWDPGQWRWR